MLFGGGRKIEWRSCEECGGSLTCARANTHLKLRFRFVAIDLTYKADPVTRRVGEKAGKVRDVESKPQHSFNFPPANADALYHSSIRIGASKIPSQRPCTSTTTDPSPRTSQPESKDTPWFPPVHTYTHHILIDPPLHTPLPEKPKDLKSRFQHLIPHYPVPPPIQLPPAIQPPIVTPHPTPPPSPSLRNTNSFNNGPSPLAHIAKNPPPRD